MDLFGTGLLALFVRFDDSAEQSPLFLESFWHSSHESFPPEGRSTEPSCELQVDHGNRQAHSVQQAFHRHGLSGHLG